MNIEHLKQRLIEKQRELVADTARLEAEARASGEAEVRDYSDDAVTSEETSESIEEDRLASDTLTQVRDALRRVDAGTYGKCSVCGRPIDQARLEAVPWARYCREDQEKQDQAERVPQGGSTL